MELSKKSNAAVGPLVHEWARQKISDTTREKNITTFKTEFV